MLRTSDTEPHQLSYFLDRYELDLEAHMRPKKLLKFKRDKLYLPYKKSRPRPSQDPKQ